MSRRAVPCQILGLVLAAAIAGAARPARADVNSDVGFALENFDLGDCPVAVQRLEQTLAGLESHQQGKSADAVRVRMLLGAIYAIGLKDDARALEQFTAALRIDPQAALDPRFLDDRT